MLTVKHRHNDGTETVFEALSVMRETQGCPTIPPCGDIILILADDPDVLGHVGPGASYEGDRRVRISANWMAKDGFDESRLFVMNRFGATVEQHRLQHPKVLQGGEGLKPTA